MSELVVGARVRVVGFDIEGLTGSVYQDLRSPIGEVGTVIRHEPEFRDCPWVVDLDGSDAVLFPDRYLPEELEVISE